MTLRDAGYIEVLSWWMDNTVEKKWATVLEALTKTGCRVLACA